MMEAAVYTISPDSLLTKENLLRAHYSSTQGTLAEEVEDLGGGVRVSSKWTASPVWNHRAWFGGSSEEFERFLNSCDTRPVAAEHVSVVYVAEPTDEEVHQILSEGFAKFDEEAWLLHDGAGKMSEATIEACDDQVLGAFATIFATVFNARCQAGAVSGAISGLRHFVLYHEEKAVAIGSLASVGQLTFIYNMATAPHARGLGFGREMLLHLIATARETDCKAVVLQAENKTTANFYRKAGFRDAFVRVGFRRHRTSVVSDVAPVLTRILRTTEAHAGQEWARELRPLPSTLIADLGRRFPSTAFSTILKAAFGYVLHRYTGLPAVQFAVRNSNGTEVREVVRIGATQSIDEWLATIGNPVSQEEVTTVPEPVLSFALGAAQGASGHPLQITLSEAQIQVAYRVDLFAKEPLRRLVAHFIKVLESMLACTGAVRDLEILPDAERQQLLISWNESGFPFAQITVPKQFEARVERAPEAVALTVAAVGGESAEQITYRQLNRRANRLAHRLLELGTGPGTPIVLLLDRSAEMVVSILATLKSGGVCVPLEPGMPADRLAQILRDLPKAFVITKRSLSSVPAFPRGTHTLYLDRGVDALHVNEKNPATVGVPGSPAYIVFTSGSTGQPKGVAVGHGEIANHCMDCQKQYGLSAKDRVLHFSSFSFDASFEQLLPPLISGASVVLRGDSVWPPNVCLEKLREHEITVADLPTPYWNEFTEYLACEGAHPVPNSLRLVIVGGEALSKDRADLWRARGPKGVRLINAYGPTEAVVTATSYEIIAERAQLSGDSPSVAIGRPRGGRKAYVLDREGRPVPIGVAGELYLAGPLLAQGYYKDPKLTAERFIADPFTDEPESRLYRTGDMVRYLEDGNLEFLGRADDQVKVRGFRIELGEIESVLRGHPDVKDALVLARQEGGKAKRLAAYVLRKSPGLTPTDVQGYLRTKLPDYMLPATVVLLNQWPLSTNGKVDRSALRQLEETSDRQAILAKPRDPLELRLQLLFERVLTRTPIGIDQNFFELGGDSLQALDLLVQIEKETGKQLPLEALFQAATVEALAGELRRRAAPQEVSSLVPLQARGKRPPLYLMHTTPGDVLGYGNLVYRLGTEQPCYGLQSPGLISHNVRDLTIEDMAAHYAELIACFQPQGPYYLAGWCYGGVLAVEVARRLQARGESVGLLALLETVAMPAPFRQWRYWSNRMARALQMSPAGWFRYARHKLRYNREANLANRMRFRRDGASREQVSRLVQLERVYNANLAALKGYKSRYYDGTITLFNAGEKDPALIPDPLYGWKGLASRVDVIEVPGSHDTMLAEPNVSVLAGRLAEHLPAAEGRLSQ